MTAALFETHTLLFIGSLQVSCSSGSPWAFSIPLSVKIVNSTNTPGSSSTYFMITGELSIGSSVIMSGGMFEVSGSSLFFSSTTLTLNGLNTALRITGVTFRFVTSGSTNIQLFNFPSTALLLQNQSVFEFSNNTLLFDGITVVPASPNYIKLMWLQGLILSDSSKLKVSQNSLIIKNCVFAGVISFNGMYMVGPFSATRGSIVEYSENLIFVKDTTSSSPGSSMYWFIPHSSTTINDQVKVILFKNAYNFTNMAMGSVTASCFRMAGPINFAASSSLNMTGNEIAFVNSSCSSPTNTVLALMYVVSPTRTQSDD